MAKKMIKNQNGINNNESNNYHIMKNFAFPFQFGENEYSKNESSITWPVLEKASLPQN